MEIDGNGLEVLDDEESLRLLARARVGRVGLTRQALPIILPVAFHLLGRDVIVRTGPGAVRDAGRRGSVLCLEADSTDPDLSVGWSVLVIGRASVVADPNDVAAVRRLPLPPWRAGNEDHEYIRIASEVVSGRRFARGSDGLPHAEAQPAPAVPWAGERDDHRLPSR